MGELARESARFTAQQMRDLAYMAAGAGASCAMQAPEAMPTEAMMRTIPALLAMFGIEELGDG